MVKLYVEEVPPIYLCCDTLLTAADIASAARFQNDNRRNEHLAWRRIIRRELGRATLIEYNEVGAPTVDTPNRHISVAHSRGMVAVAIADERVGIDIETSERNFERAASRFLSEEERALCSDELWPAMVWTAKEAMYKYYGERGVELDEDLRIVGYDSTRQLMRGELRGEHGVTIAISRHAERYIVAVATRSKIERE